MCILRGTKAKPQRSPLVALPERCRYILRRDHVPTLRPIRAKEVPAGDGWVHEVKFDGYRVQI